MFVNFSFRLINFKKLLLKLISFCRAGILPLLMATIISTTVRAKVSPLLLPNQFSLGYNALRLHDFDFCAKTFSSLDPQDSELENRALLYETRCLLGLGKSIEAQEIFSFVQPEELEELDTWLYNRLSKSLTDDDKLLGIRNSAITPYLGSQTYSNSDPWRKGSQFYGLHLQVSVYHHVITTQSENTHIEFSNGNTESSNSNIVRYDNRINRHWQLGFTFGRAIDSKPSYAHSFEGLHIAHINPPSSSQWALYIFKTNHRWENGETLNGLQWSPSVRSPLLLDGQMRAEFSLHYRQHLNQIHNSLLGVYNKDYLFYETGLFWIPNDYWVGLSIANGSEQFGLRKDGLFFPVSQQLNLATQELKLGRMFKSSVLKSWINSNLLFQITYTQSQYSLWNVRAQSRTIFSLFTLEI